LDWKNQQEELSTEEIEVRHPVRDDGALSSRSSDEAEAKHRNLRFRDLYETTGEVHLVCLLADAETISFEEVVRDPK
jgi:hypothetical protein